MYGWSVIAFVLLNLIIIILISRGDADEESLSAASTMAELRSRQISGLREHAIKKKLEETVEERSGNEKKFKNEEMLMRAGLVGWSYGELILTKLGSALIGTLISWLFLNNLVLTIAIAITFYILPSQIVSTIANRRVAAMEKEIGTFIQLTIERYKVHHDFQKAIKQTADDFNGLEPMNSEIRQTILEFDTGQFSTAQAVRNMGKRTGNKFITQMANYYEIASTIGTEDSRDKILGQAWENYNEDYKMKQRLAQEIDGPKKDAYIVVGALPVLMFYQTTVDDTYLDFFLNTTIGQIGLAVILVVVVLSIIFINKKIAAPLD